MELIVKASNIHVEYLDKEVLNIPEVEIYDCDRILKRVTIIIKWY
jgi:nitrate reductase NapAB chaperone NapD